jgi:hypothetical protein
MPQAVAEKLAREQDGVILTRMPRAEGRADERADDPSPLHQPGNLHALANRRPSHQRTAFPPAREGPRGPDGRAGKCTLTSAVIVKPNTFRWKAAGAPACPVYCRRKPGEPDRKRNTEQEASGTAHFLSPEKC